MARSSTRQQPSHETTPPAHGPAGSADPDDAAGPAGSDSPAGPGSPGGSAGTGGRRVGIIALALLVAAAGFVAGRATTSGGTPSRAAGTAVTHAGHGVGGLGVTADGYTLVLLATPTVAGAAGELAFQIIGPDGEPVTAYQPNHERDLHLVLVGRDFTGYQHLHPARQPDGTWRVPVTLSTGGAYRIFADFVPTGATTPVTLGADLLVPGGYAPRPALPVDEATVFVDGGYTVTLDGGLRPGQASQILVWLGRDGVPVPDLERYLGAYGHLVALRHGDLGYLHVHPAPAASPSSVVAFAVEVPSAGTYQLFFEFQHDGVVRTAEFSLTAY
ncbi:hypothetical protein [Micromonospora sp. NBC_01813]|uniref:hypothetical protein n=1 Tax=Micromonospora sp. NBC_01813 TaxID=2975988 RepID=UPI002DDB9C06|nr:hypothetical protein [Micromonospora sp. NBC_01813]WSA10033.1 hypothetical protein OG958_04345 [Micromonospora sp. NBC_01813]